MISFKKAFLYVLIIAIFYRLPGIPDTIVDTYSLEILRFIHKRLYFLIFPLIAIFLLKANFKEFKKLFILEQKNKIAPITLASFVGYVFFFISFLMLIYAITVAVNFTIPVYEKKAESYLGIFYLVVISSVFEEFFFRRILAHQFFKKYGLIKAIFYSALLFTIIHSWALPTVFIGGLLLAYIYLKTRNIYIAIGVHSLHNLHTCLSNGSTYPLVLFFEKFKDINYFWWYYTIGFFISIWLLYYSFRYINNYYAKYIHQ